MVCLSSFLGMSWGAVKLVELLFWVLLFGTATLSAMVVLSIVSILWLNRPGFDGIFVPVGK